MCMYVCTPVLNSYVSSFLLSYDGSVQTVLNVLLQFLLHDMYIFICGHIHDNNNFVQTNFALF